MEGDWSLVRQVMDLTNTKILGHKGIGVIEEAEPGVTRLRKGNRVGMNYWCRGCELCLLRYPHWCSNTKYTSVNTNGTYAEYAIIHEIVAPKVPKEVSEIEAAPIIWGNYSIWAVSLN